MTDLETCPCCGGEGQLKDVHGRIRHGWVGCPECRLFINWNIDPAGAVRAWNRRAADVRENKRGHWIPVKPYNNTYVGFECPECGAQFQGPHMDNYCGNCGARMEADK